LSLPPPVPLLAPGARPRRPVRVAVVGLGKMGLAHTALLATIDGVELVGLADRARGAGRGLRGLGFRAPLFGDLDALLAAVRPDAVWVCTPPDAHCAVATRCLAAGAAVFVEKPLAHTLADAVRIADAAAERGVPAACGYALAFWPSFAAGAHAVEAGVLGAVRRAAFTMYLSQVSGPKRGWMYERARSGGGVVANVSSHALFVLRWYLGMPLRVTARWRCVSGEVEDEVDAVFELAGGVEARFASSWTVPGHPIAWAAAELEGDAGRLAVDNDTLELVTERPAAGWPAGRTRLGVADLPQPAAFHLNGEAYWLEDARFLEWVAGGAVPPTTVRTAVDVQRMMDALYRSAAREGEPVDV
jgi:scyllo-inositol 2-dehydrogenase (NADP+)